MPAQYLWLHRRFKTRPEGEGIFMLKENTACSDSRYAVLFESVKIGPVTAPNRFYRTPHCNGMGHLRPQAWPPCVALRPKAAGEWFSTEETEIHPSSDVSPYAEGRLWSDDDIPAHALVTESIHRQRRQTSL